MKGQRLSPTAEQSRKERKGETFVLSVDHSNTLPAAADQGSTWVINERPDGFTITLPTRPRVKVRWRAIYFEVESQRGQKQKVGLNERQLRDAIVNGLMDGWKPPSGCRPSAGWPPQRWIVAQVRRLLADPVKAQCDRLLQVGDPSVPAVHQALSAVRSRPSTLAMCPDLYAHPHLVADIINYRAAAIVAGNAEHLVHRARQMQIDNSTELADLKAFGATHGATITVHAHPIGSSVGNTLALLQEWRNLLSPSGQSYRSLDRTLMALPRNVPSRLVCLLNQVTLPRPLTDPLELLTVTLYLDCRYMGANSAKEPVFLTARAPQIRDAVRRVAAHTGNDLRVTRQRDLRFLVRFLLDFPDLHRGTIVGLAKKAIRWHQNRRAERRAKILDQYGAETRVEMPPIPPPSDSVVHHLETVDEIVREGERMGHCVASYVPHALRGGYYLFHVEHEAEAATVMVRRDGQVVDAAGPRNRRNGASQWGERRLARWARGLRTEEAQKARIQPC